MNGNKKTKATRSDFDSWTAADKRLARDIRKRQSEHMSRTKADSLAIEFGISYDKACFLLMKDEEEREIRHAKRIVERAAKGLPFTLATESAEDEDS